MKANESQQNPAGRRRGPRRLEYVPELIRGVDGVEHLTTVRQAERLASYLTAKEADREPFIRLGASVHAKKTGESPSAIYAVDIDGTVNVLMRVGDPRRTHLWMQGAARPWNLCRAPAFKEFTERHTTFMIVTLASIDEGGDEEAKCGDADVLPACLVPDGKTIMRVWPGRLNCDSGGVDRDYVVEAVPGWWIDHDFGTLCTLREASGDVFSHVEGTLWATRDEVVEFLASTWADSVLLPHQGERIVNVDDFLNEKLVATLSLRLRTRAMWNRRDSAEEAVLDAVKSAKVNFNIRTASLKDVAHLEDHALELLATDPEACA